MTRGIGAVVVSYNTRDLLRACLASLRPEEPDEVVVVDNASPDGSADMVRKELPWVRLIANPDNRGFGSAANQGFAACRSPCVLLLNADTEVAPGALAALRRELDRHPEAAVAGPRLLDPDGSHQPSCYPFLTPFNLLALGTWLNRLVRVAPSLRRRFLPVWAPGPACSVDWVKGAAMAIRRQAFEAVGGFDASFFLYAEEMDLCWRLRAAGWEVRFTPEARVVHVEGASTRQRRAAMFLQQFASLEQFYRRHYPPSYRTRLRWAVSATMTEWLVRDSLKLLAAKDPGRRRRLAEDVRLWRLLLGGRASP
ncbi:MAG TPA: glycosyltransferase family 2 protein [Thermoanaerobaculia bacterium]